MHLIKLAKQRTDISYGDTNITFSRVIGGELFTVNHPISDRLTLRGFTSMVKQAARLDNDIFKQMSDSLHDYEEK